MRRRRLLPCASAWHHASGGDSFRQFFAVAARPSACDSYHARSITGNHIGGCDCLCGLWVHHQLIPDVRSSRCRHRPLDVWNSFSGIARSFCFMRREAYRARTISALLDFWESNSSCSFRRNPSDCRSFRRLNRGWFRLSLDLPVSPPEPVLAGEEVQGLDH